tara:strand:+ start:393 stop:791 length:399 start_codon:yes stop_codon:yes gene_type:complete
MCGGGAVGVVGTGMQGEVGGLGNTLNNRQYGGHSDVQSPQFDNTNGELRGGGRGGKFLYYSTGTTTTVLDGGFLAGGGAAGTEHSGRAATGGDGGIGGGGGTANSITGSTEGTCNSGQGGNGLIIVMYTAIG